MTRTVKFGVAGLLAFWFGAAYAWGFWHGEREHYLYAYDGYRRVA